LSRDLLPIKHPREKEMEDLKMVGDRELGLEEAWLEVTLHHITLGIGRENGRGRERGSGKETEIEMWIL